MLFQPLQGFPIDPVLAGFLKIILYAGRFLIEMLRTHDFAELIGILRIHHTVQRLLEVLMIISGIHLFDLGILIDPDPLALAVLQINRSHNAVA